MCNICWVVFVLLFKTCITKKAQSKSFLIRAVDLQSFHTTYVAFGSNQLNYKKNKQWGCERMIESSGTELYMLT